MTVKEFATLHKVSTQAVYKRINRAGYSMAQLAEAETGVLTEVGVEVLNSLYQQQTDEKKSKPLDHVDRLTYDRLVATHEKLQAEHAAQVAANEALQAQLAQAEDKAARAEQAATEAKEEAERWYQMAMSLTERVPKLVAAPDQDSAPAADPSQGKPLTIRQKFGRWIAGDSKQDQKSRK